MAKVLVESKSRPPQRQQDVSGRQRPHRRRPMCTLGKGKGWKTGRSEAQSRADFGMHMEKCIRPCFRLPTSRNETIGIHLMRRGDLTASRCHHLISSC